MNKKNKVGKVLKQNNLFLERSFFDTAQEIKCFLSMCFIARIQLLKDKNRRLFSIEVKDLKKLANIKPTSMNELKMTLLNLMDLSIEQGDRTIDETDWFYCHLFSYIQIEKGILTFQLPEPLIKDFIYPNNYTNLDITVTNMLKSKYAILLYFQARRYMKVQIPKMSIQKLRYIFSIKDEQYMNFAHLEKYAIIPARKEINEKTEFNIEYKATSEGASKKVTHIKFMANLKPEYKRLQLKEKIERFSKQYQDNSYSADPNFINIMNIKGENK